jgi:hypothetical protein
MNIYQLIICAVLLAILIAVLYAFLKTPPAQRWAITRPSEVKKEGVECAPMYSKSERLRIAILHLCWLFPTFIFFQYYLLPKFKEFAEHAECYKIASISGTEILFFGLLVGGPLLGAITAFATQGILSLRALRAGQYPPPHVKVFRLTPYKYGIAAKIPAVANFLIILSFLGMSVFGGYVASGLTKQVKLCQATQPHPGLNQ